MALWKKLFGTRDETAPGVEDGRKKDVEALFASAYHAVDFITRHNMTGIYNGLGGTEMYCERVVKTFMIAAETIVPRKDVEAIFKAVKLRDQPWSDRAMCSVFLPLLDEAIAIIGTTSEVVMPLFVLKADLERFNRR